MLDKIKEIVKSVFEPDMLLCFWTHEKCPPSVNDDFKKCQLDKDIKHKKCMPCWEEWVAGLADNVATKILSLFPKEDIK